ncbi:hypothetical protein J6590_032307 [Homalodisca vitripennis]|nr:hypothetical protein J6590_032307 [Homalodisca vitripennis]
MTSWSMNLFEIFIISIFVQKLELYQHSCRQYFIIEKLLWIHENTVCTNRKLRTSTTQLPSYQEQYNLKRVVVKNFIGDNDVVYEDTLPSYQEQCDLKRVVVKKIIGDNDVVYEDTVYTNRKLRTSTTQLPSYQEQCDLKRVVVKNFIGDNDVVYEDTV